MEENSQSCSFMPFDHIDRQDHLLYGFSDCFGDATSVFDELDELYKPFYPQAAINQLTTSSSSSSSSSMQYVVPGAVVKEPHHDDLQKQQPLTNLPTVDTSKVISTTAATMTMPKRRKNQHKRVVKQVTVDELSSDTWAWRKYGQKPIKGSPYPRSYYRCSSSKGCPARKQVERSSTDPMMFIISYTAEHSHGHPVRRNSLAGIAKKKSSTTMKNPTSTSDPETPTLKDSSCCSPISSTTALSPTSPLMACLEDEFFPQHESKRERMEEEEQMIIKDSMMSNSVLFSSYEGLDGLTSDDLSAFECWFSDQIQATFQS